MLRLWKAFAFVGCAIPALAAIPARPGTLNYVEGSVLIAGEAASSASIGSTELKPGQTLKTEAGKAEILLTPGVFLRLGSNSQVRMLSPGLTDTRIALDRGVAMLDASQVYKENNIQITDGTLTSAIQKKGIYRFDADRSAVAVLDGKVEVRQGDEKVNLKKGRLVVANEDEDAKLKAEKFDVGDVKDTDELYQWSKLRSKYLSEASQTTAHQIYSRGMGWYGSGWYWNPWRSTYSWLPARDSFFSPFGYGFYSPYAWYPRVYYTPRYPRWSGSRPGIGAGRGPSISPGRSGGRSTGAGPSRGRGR